MIIRLRIFQGPALVFANSATSAARDFEAFKAVCQGQRRQDISTIGAFGRGALTMYSWAEETQSVLPRQLVAIF